MNAVSRFPSSVFSVSGFSVGLMLAVVAVHTLVGGAATVALQARSKAALDPLEVVRAEPIVIRGQRLAVLKAERIEVRPAQLALVKAERITIVGSSKLI